MRFIIVALFIGIVVNPLVGVALFLLIAIPSIHKAHASYIENRPPPRSVEFDAYFADWQAK